MIPEKLLEILKQDGVVAIATLGKDGPHMVNTWNSYIRISPDGRLFIPAGYMHKTEANIAYNPNVLITLGSSKVQGLRGAGTGYLIKGKAAFITSGPDFDFMKAKFSWLRATLAILSILLLKLCEGDGTVCTLQFRGFGKHATRVEYRLPNNELKATR
jgi:predicted pyridoxine 5'-phosphate oxidase superfamily flavin-nucleotide-binding protein